jgi:DNA invertase Pin-like site-specific DNA recombinase
MRRLEAYCHVRGWKIGGRYRDEGCSGTDVNRPEYQNMFQESDNWDVLVVLKMDRIHRNSVNFTLMMNDLRNNGKEFNSMQEKFDTTTAMGRFVMDIMQRIAQLESEQIGERVKVGMTQKASFGTGPMGSGHPYGYVYCKGNLEVIEDEAYTVSAIYRLYNEGYSMEDIANSLNRSKIPAKKGGQWNRQSICNILHNPIYLGYIEWDGIIRKGGHCAIIERESYEAVNGPLDV